MTTDGEIPIEEHYRSLRLGMHFAVREIKNLWKWQVGLLQYQVAFMLPIHFVKMGVLELPFVSQSVSPSVRPSHFVSVIT